MANGFADESRLFDLVPVVDLIDRQQLVELVEAPLLDARMNNTGAAIVYLHLENFRAADDHLGGALLTDAAHRLQRRIRRGDLLGRHQDDIIILLTGLDPRGAAEEAEQIAAPLAAELAMLTVTDSPDPLIVTVGISTFPADGLDADGLVMVAESRSFQKVVQP